MAFGMGMGEQFGGGFPFSLFNQFQYGQGQGMAGGGGGGPGGFLSGLFAKGGFMGGPGGMALTSFGLPLLARMFGGGNAQQKAFSDWQNQRAAIMNPNWLYNRVGAYQPLINQMSQGQRAGILNNANAFQGNLSRNLAATGMNRTGIGALAATAGSSMAANNLNDLQSENRRQAMSLGLSDRNNLMSMLNFGPMAAPTPGLDAFAAGGDNFMGYLMDRKMYGGNNRAY